MHTQPSYSDLSGRPRGKNKNAHGFSLSLKKTELTPLTLNTTSETSVIPSRENKSAWIKSLGAGLQSIECLQCKPNNLHSTHAEKLGKGVSTCNLNTGEAETGRALNGQSVLPHQSSCRPRETNVYTHLSTTCLAHCNNLIHAKYWQSIAHTRAQQSTCPALLQGSNQQSRRKTDLGTNSEQKKREEYLTPLVKN